MEIKLWDNFSKRRNSTKAPTETDVPVVRSAVLKDSCSKTHPSFFIQGIAEYTYVEAFGRYYFVDNVEYDINDAEWLHCSIDVLATWKTQIGLTSAFIEYSTSSYSANLIDERISQLTTRTKQRNVASSIFTDTFNSGCYVLSTAEEVHGAASYILEKGNLDFIVADLISNSPTEISNWQEMFGDALGSIIGLRYIPIPYTYFPWDDPALVQDVVLGAYNTQTTGILYDGRIYQQRTLQIPWTYSDFRRCSEYTRFILCLPFIGPVELMPENIIDQSTITIRMVGNCVTGAISYGIYVDGSPNLKLIASYSGTFGMQIPIAQSQVDLNGILNSGLTIGGAWGAALLTRNPALQAASAGVAIGAMVRGIVSANMQDFSMVGSYSGNWSELLLSQYEIISYAVDTRTDPASMATLYGRPCMQVKQINALTGYVKTSGFSIEIDELQSVRDMINSAMDSGVYLE